MTTPTLVPPVAMPPELDAYLMANGAPPILPTLDKILWLVDEVVALRHQQRMRDRVENAHRLAMQSEAEARRNQPPKPQEPPAPPAPVANDAPPVPESPPPQ